LRRFDHSAARADETMSAPPEQASAMRPASLHRLSLRAKGGLTLAGLVLYVVLVGTVISHSRDK
jgi:hypothetical protein